MTANTVKQIYSTIQVQKAISRHDGSMLHLAVQLLMKRGKLTDQRNCEYVPVNKERKSILIERQFTTGQ